MTVTFKELLAVVSTVVISFFVFGNISTKAGYPRWYGGLMAIPFVNLIVIVWFAYTSWPIESELLQLRFGGSKPASGGVKPS